MQIELTAQSDHFERFTANWTDDKFRYHVWIDITASNRVVIGDTIYKNTIEHVRFAKTGQLSINAKAHAAVKAEIERIATLVALRALFNARRDEQKRQDAIWAEAERLNAIFNAWRIVNSATVDEKMALGLI